MKLINATPRFVAICFPLLLFGTMCCSAQQWVGIESPKVNEFAVAQWQDEWCWAASAQFILNGYGIAVTQADIVRRIHGNFLNQSGSDFDISASLNGWAPTSSGIRVVRSVEGVGMPAPLVLIDQLQRQHPILIAFQSGPSSGHAVVITAAAYVATPGGPQVVALVTRDPWPSLDHIASIGRVEYDGPELVGFAMRVRSHWLVSVN